MGQERRTAIVTGAAQGIGEAVAVRLAAEGVERFLLIDRQEAQLQKVGGALEAAGVQVQCLTLDLTDIGALKKRVSHAVSMLRRVEILINAAGTTARGGLADTTSETLDYIYQLNLRAPFFMMQMVSPAMPKHSVIVNITSILAYGGPPFLLGYSVSKAGLVAMTRSVANTLKRDGIHVFGINLGWTWTPAEQQVQTELHGMPEDWKNLVGAKQPFGKLLMPEDPAGLIAFLISRDAAMMTGAIIDLDQFVAGTVDDNPGAI